MKRVGNSYSRAFQHIPDVDSHPQTEKFHFIDQRNIHATEDILEKFRHFGCTCGANQVRALKRLPEERLGRQCAFAVGAADHLGDLRVPELLIARVFPFR